MSRIPSSRANIAGCFSSSRRARALWKEILAKWYRSIWGGKPEEATVRACFSTRFPNTVCLHKKSFFSFKTAAKQARLKIKKLTQAQRAFQRAILIGVYSTKRRRLRFWRNTRQCVSILFDRCQHQCMVFVFVIYNLQRQSIFRNRQQTQFVRGPPFRHPLQKATIALNRFFAYFFRLGTDS